MTSPATPVAPTTWMPVAPTWLVEKRRLVRVWVLGLVLGLALGLGLGLALVRVLVMPRERRIVRIPAADSAADAPRRQLHQAPATPPTPVTPVTPE